MKQNDVATFSQPRELLSSIIAPADLSSEPVQTDDAVDSSNGRKSEIFTKCPNVSVLVPVFNGEDYLAECLDSILNQKFCDLEILIADDASTDGSLEIIKSYARRDVRIRWWSNPRNLGLTANSNVCLKSAQGEYIKFVHQDDLLLSPLTIQRMVAMLDAHPEASLAGSRQHLTGTDSKPTIFSKRSGCFAGRQMIVKSFERNTNLIGQPTLTLFRRLQAQRGFDERFTSTMDFEMWCHLLEQGDFAYLDEPLATWRVHERQQTARRSKKADHEHLRFILIYCARPLWREITTARMLFAQIYQLRKKYGAKALPLIAALMTQLSPQRYRWEWLKYKISTPFRKLSRKLS